MNRFYIVRHGKTLNNEAGRLSGWVDTPLVANGLEPTDRVITKIRDIPFQAIYSSDSGRAFLTAYYIARALGYEQEIFKVPALREVNYGDAAHMLRDEAYAAYPGLDSNTNYKVPNGESLAEMQARAIAGVVDIDRKHTDADILVVAHSGVMAAFKSGHTGQDFGEHNISEAYEHDFIGIFTVANGVIATFEPYALAA